MKKINRSVFFSVLVALAYVLSACSGVPAGQSSNDQSSQSGQVQEVVFTGTVDSMGGGEWTISGQAVTVDGATSVDANIAVGNNVKVEARVGQDGKVIAVRVELAGADNANANSNDDNQNDDNANDNAASNSNDNQGDNSNSNADNGNDNGNDNSSDGVQQEVSGVVEVIATDAITIAGVAYMIADFTEFKDIIAVGDQVKAQVLVNLDGTFTIIEIEKIDGTSLDNGNSNSNDNGSDDNSNGNVSNGNDNNSNDDNSNGNGNDDNSNDNGNDDNSNDDNGNDDNGNDDNGNDDNSNSNGNG